MKIYNIQNVLYKTGVAYHCTAAVIFYLDGIGEFYWWQHMLDPGTSCSIAQNESPM